MRSFLAALFVMVLGVAHAQGRISRADAALVGRLLLAEDRRDASDGAFAAATKHADPRIRAIARRALGRIRDPHFSERDSEPPLPKPPTWSEPDWLLRYRKLSAPGSDCAALRTTLGDSVAPVRLRAADLVMEGCASDDVIADTLRKWIDALPADASKRAPGDVSWHAAAHAIVALARIRPDDARARLPLLAAHKQWQVRMYAARAAAVLADAVRLRMLARDRDDNVKEAAVEALSKLTGHTDDAIYLATLHAHGAQAVRAAAIALKGSPRADVRDIANAVFDQWVAQGIASARDVRLALLAAANRADSDDVPPPIHTELPPQSVALAFGADVRLRVTISPQSGGGSFVVRLRGDVAPIMAARILRLIGKHYYDGLTWHRVVPDFVIQGGSSGASEYIGYTQFLRDELGTVPHLRGTVGMSTRGHDTGDAQWFVNLHDNLRLDNNYTVFGEVVEGMDTVDGILEGDRIASIRLISFTQP